MEKLTQYVLHAPVHNPVYGQVMALQPMAMPSVPSAHKFQPPEAHKFQPPDTRAPAAVKFYAPAALKHTTPAMKAASPSIKFDSPAIKFDSPAIKFDSGAGGAGAPVVIASRPVAGNSFVVTTGLGDLFDAVSRAGGVILVVE
jgi:hypothetical protein